MSIRQMACNRGGLRWGKAEAGEPGLGETAATPQFWLPHSARSPRNDAVTRSRLPGGMVLG